MKDSGYHLAIPFFITSKHLLYHCESWVKTYQSKLGQSSLLPQQKHSKVNDSLAFCVAYPIVILPPCISLFIFLDTLVFRSLVNFRFDFSIIKLQQYSSFCAGLRNYRKGWLLNRLQPRLKLPLNEMFSPLPHNLTSNSTDLDSCHLVFLVWKRYNRDLF